MPQVANVTSSMLLYILLLLLIGSIGGEPKAGVVLVLVLMLLS
jgi:hypothetical protein